MFMSIKQVRFFFLSFAVMLLAACAVPLSPDGQAPGTVSDPATATAEDPNAAILSAAEDAGILVYTVQEQQSDQRYQLNLLIPVTDNEAIDARLGAMADEFITEYHNTAQEVAADYRKYREETGETAATFHADYMQSFRIARADEALLAFVVEQYRNTGNTGSDDVTGYTFDRSTGEELTLTDFFVDDSYLARLSDLTRAQLIQRYTNETGDMSFDSDAAKQEYLDNMQSMVEAGTTPEAKNFDGLVFQADNSVLIVFDKYQVAPGAWGNPEITVPLDAIQDLLTPRMSDLLGLDG